MPPAPRQPRKGEPTPGNADREPQSDVRDVEVDLALSQTSLYPSVPQSPQIPTCFSIPPIPPPIAPPPSPQPSLASPPPPPAILPTVARPRVAPFVAPAPTPSFAPPTLPQQQPGVVNAPLSEPQGTVPPTLPPLLPQSNSRRLFQRWRVWLMGGYFPAQPFQQQMAHLGAHSNKAAWAIGAQFGATASQPLLAFDPAFGQVVESVRARIELEELEELHRRQISLSGSFVSRSRSWPFIASFNAPMLCIVFNLLQGLVPLCPGAVHGRSLPRLMPTAFVECKVFKLQQYL
eukprot:5635200-Pleurochrysis_carterae.AAC.1